jgi:undecaprenyl phosphate-alpha-L-ara4N flippase subunit ArnE
MSDALTPWSLGLLLFCVVADIGRELNFKAASLQADRAGYVASLLTRPLLWLGLLLWAIEVVAWLLVLEQVPLAVAFPVMALTYAGTPLAAGLVLRETLTRGQKAGAALVALGVLVVSVSELKVQAP